MLDELLKLSAAGSAGIKWLNAQDKKHCSEYHRAVPRTGASVCRVGLRAQRAVPGCTLST